MLVRGIVNRSALAAMLAVAGCARSPTPTGVTVEYYRAHAAERQAMVRQCANTPGELRRSPACVNALQATRVEDVGSLRQLPALGLQGTDPQKPPHGAEPLR
jgi:hypothetical protein